ncbi:hypothetical protein NDU88_003335 [Pleurodeles waltl]|uniref:Uncharacterized protein n=1 Tax=Pleurodeles waltl TaxID=8319 RepID=A0AAV7RH41_PLEWA|nr:hypothetical protein NDU88_003335 [Pleurodeles waltl]
MVNPCPENKIRSKIQSPTAKSSQKMLWQSLFLKNIFACISHLRKGYHLVDGSLRPHLSLPGAGKHCPSFRKEERVPMMKKGTTDYSERTESRDQEDAESQKEETPITKRGTRDPKDEQNTGAEKGAGAVTQDT